MVRVSGGFGGSMGRGGHDLPMTTAKKTGSNKTDVFLFGKYIFYLRDSGTRAA
jgi:hypothetical protein